MKASNILLVSLIGSITLTILTIITDIRFSGTFHKYTEYDEKNLDVPTFTHLIIDDVQREVFIEAADSYALTLVTMKGEQMPSVTYQVQGDTLYVNHFENHELGAARLVVRAPEGALKRISGKNAEINLSKYPFERLSIYLDNSRVNIYPGAERHASLLQITGLNESRLNSDMLQADTLDIQLSKSFITFQGTVQLLQGSMEHESILGVREVNTFEFRKDPSCRLDHWN
jgi:hypothetical protein